MQILSHDDYYGQYREFEPAPIQPHLFSFAFYIQGNADLIGSIPISQKGYYLLKEWSEVLLLSTSKSL